MFRNCLLALFALLLVAAPAAQAQEALRVVGPPVHIAGDGDTFFMKPVWSPDGTQLAVTGARYEGLWTVDARGGEQRHISDEPAAGFGFSWSSDGSALLARVARFDGHRRLNAVKVFDLGADEVRQLTPYRPQMPALPRWAANDSKILLHVDRDGIEVLESGIPAAPGKSSAAAPAFLLAGDRIVRALPDAERAETVDILSDERILNLAVSPDGDRIAFEVMGGNLFVASTDGSGAIDLGPGNRPSWSPDGRWVVFMRAEDDGHDYTAADLFAARSDGSNLVRLTDTPGRLEMNPSWSPDGGRIAFDAFDEGAIYVLPVSMVE